MEHVGDFEDQGRYAAEVRRVGDGYLVQTGNQRFPVELHSSRRSSTDSRSRGSGPLIRNFTA